MKWVHSKGAARAAVRIAAMSALLLLSVWPAARRRHIHAQTQTPDISMSTQDRVQFSDWWPTKGDAAKSAYAPADACDQCHAGIAAAQHATPMYQAAHPASDSELLRTNPRLAFADGTYTYIVENLPGGPALSVVRGAVTSPSAQDSGTNGSREKIVWTFGEGEVGETWLLEKDGVYTEGRVSYYTALHALDITTGHSRDVPSTPELALGNRLDAATARACFGCHTTMSTSAGVFNPAEATPGITCQACHGPGAAHVLDMSGDRSGSGATSKASNIFNPASLPPTASVDFCGACHRTWVDVAMGMPPNLGAIVVRFQPYRLEESRCWGKSGDARITCIACHDPHRPLVRDAASYDRNCLACHTAGERNTRAKIPPAVCRSTASASHCVTCHMQKVEVPAAHATFTDHDIRIVQSEKTLPE
jgi:hypothetical protein